MTEIKKNSSYPWFILPFFALVYMTDAVYQNYYSNFLVGRGIEQSAIGTIMAISPIAALLAQPIWGAAGDRMKWKNTLLTWLTGISALVLVAAGFVNAVWSAMAVVCAYAFFHDSISPLLTAMALETLEKGRFRFGPVRMSGTVAYAVTAPVIGFVMANHYGLAPFFAALFLGMGLIASFFLPKVEGHQHGKREKVSMMRLLKNKPLMLMTLFCIAQNIGCAHFNTYFSLYMEGMGASSGLIGVAYFLSAVAEIPFLLMGDRIFRKIGVGGLLILSTVAASLRMLFTGMSQSAGLAAVAQLLHGWDTIVMMFAMAKYINLTVPDDLKASGQMLFNVIALGVARAVGSWISGQLVGLTDLRMPFYFSAAICLISVVIFGAIILKNRDLRSAGREE